MKRQMSLFNTTQFISAYKNPRMSQFNIEDPIDRMGNINSYYVHDEFNMHSLNESDHFTPLITNRSILQWHHLPIKKACCQTFEIVAVFKFILLN